LRSSPFRAIPIGTNKKQECGIAYECNVSEWNEGSSIITNGSMFTGFFE